MLTKAAVSTNFISSRGKFEEERAWGGDEEGLTLSDTENTRVVWIGVSGLNFLSIGGGTAEMRYTLPSPRHGSLGLSRWQRLPKAWKTLIKPYIPTAIQRAITRKWLTTNGLAILTPPIRLAKALHK